MATKRNLIITIRRRQISFFGHVMRNKEIENFSISGKIEGKRCRGRQRITYTKSLSVWMKVEETEMIRASKDRDKWNTMTVKALIMHDTPERRRNRKKYVYKFGNILIYFSRIYYLELDDSSID